MNRLEKLKPMTMKRNSHKIKKNINSSINKEKETRKK